MRGVRESLTLDPMTVVMASSRLNARMIFNSSVRTV